MKRGHLYRNKLMRDVDFFVIRSITREVSGWWVLRSTGKLLEHDTIDRSRINPEDWTDLGAPPEVTEKREPDLGL